MHFFPFFLFLEVAICYTFSLAFHHLQTLYFHSCISPNSYWAWVRHLVNVYGLKDNVKISFPFISYRFLFCLNLCCVVLLIYPVMFNIFLWSKVQYDKQNKTKPLWKVVEVVDKESLKISMVFISFQRRLQWTKKCFSSCTYRHVLLSSGKKRKIDGLHRG